MRVLRSGPDVGAASASAEDTSAGNIQSRVLWEVPGLSYDQLWEVQDEAHVAALTECSAPQDAPGRMEFTAASHGGTVAHCLAGSYRLAIPAVGFSRQISQGQFFHTDVLQKLSDKVGAVIDTEPGTRWRYFAQHWGLRFKGAKHRVWAEPADIALPDGGVLIVVDGETDLGDGTFVVRTDEAGTVALRRGWAWRIVPAQEAAA